MSRRMRRKPRSQESGLFTLNITSMTDMFTLLLVFLLQTYATSDFRVELPQDVSLPLSSVENEPVKVPQITISPTDVKLDGEVIVALENGRVKGTDMESGGLVKPLFEALKGKLPAAVEGEKPDNSVLLLADSSQDMADLNPYLSTIAAAGFGKVKLATLLGR